MFTICREQMTALFSSIRNLRTKLIDLVVQRLEISKIIIEPANNRPSPIFIFDMLQAKFKDVNHRIL